MRAPGDLADSAPLSALPPFLEGSSLQTQPLWGPELAGWGRGLSGAAGSPPISCGF